jgi:hypothetical protein
VRHIQDFSGLWGSFGAAGAVGVAKDKYFWFASPLHVVGTWRVVYLSKNSTCEIRDISHHVELKKLSDLHNGSIERPTGIAIIHFSQTSFGEKYGFGGGPSDGNNLPIEEVLVMNC